MIAVVDYRKGNLKSVERGLIAAGGDAVVTDDPSAIAAAAAIVLPGVGAFADAAETMHELGQMEVIREAVRRGVPFLGICLGMHLMFEEGEEGAIATSDGADPVRPKGLAVLTGIVTQLPRFDVDGNAYKIPHVGWNSCETVAAGTSAHASSAATTTDLGDGWGGEARDAVHDGRSGEARDGARCPLFDGIDEGEFFYFTHSYVAPDTPATISLTRHSITFPSVVQYGACAFGVQFHPEKSSCVGALMLRNFVRLASEALRVS